MQQYLRYLYIFLIVSSCKITDRSEEVGDVNFKKEMRNFVVGISQYSKTYNSDFVVIPQNGAPLILQNAEAWGEVNTAYIDAIDGQAQEGLNYGYVHMDMPTSLQVYDNTKTFLDSAKQHRKTILVTDYCTIPSAVDNSLSTNLSNGYTGFVATQRALNNIPSYAIFQENNLTVTNLSQAKNFLYILDYSQFSSKSDFMNAVCQTNYDLLIIDAFFDDTAFTTQEIERLKHKQNGGTRMVVAYMSIGEAENYRFYWQSSWSSHVPEWLEEENPNWQGNFKVKYWKKSWQDLIYGNDNSYTKKIINQGFDGVYLDIIDAYEYFEEKYN